jgi:hypothetical protein
MVETTVGIELAFKDRLELTVIAVSGDQHQLRIALISYQ